MRFVLVVLSVYYTVAVNADCREEKGEAAQLACYDRIVSCKGLDDSARLACFLVGGKTQVIDTSPNKGLAGTIVQPEVKAVSVAAVEAAFPAPRQYVEEEAQAPEIHSSIVALQKDARGYFYLTLANGHIWREKESVRNRYKEGDQIIISKGALDSNQLRIVDKGRMVRVERYK